MYFVDINMVFHSTNSLFTLHIAD